MLTYFYERKTEPESSALSRRFTPSPIYVAGRQALPRLEWATTTYWLLGYNISETGIFNVYIVFFNLEKSLIGAVPSQRWKGFSLFLQTVWPILTFIPSLSFNVMLNVPGPPNLYVCWQCFYRILWEFSNLKKYFKSVCNSILAINHPSVNLDSFNSFNRFFCQPIPLFFFDII